MFWFLNAEHLHRRSLLATGIAALIAAIVGQAALAPGQVPATVRAAGFSQLPMQFEPNVGQVRPAVSYVAHTPGGAFHFSPSEVVMSLDSARSGQNGTAAVRMQFLGANAATLHAGQELPGKANYLTGNDPAGWHTGIPTYAGITYSSLYEGIDLAYEGQGGQLKGTYTVAPGADATAIRWRYAGAQQVAVDAGGNLQVSVGSGDNSTRITEHTPSAWQTVRGKQVPVSARYVVAGDSSIGFELGIYDASLPLVIDPALTFSSYLGGSDVDQGMGVATDSSGNIYVIGYTASTDFPTSNGYEPTFQGTNDAFLVKLQPNGTVIYSTYLGGGGDDKGHGVAVDGTGAPYLTGPTNSMNFPTTLTAYQPARLSSGSSFLTKLTPDGASLAYSTYFGPTTNSFESWGVAVDGANGAYIGGYTNSTTVPVRNAYQPTYAGYNDAFLARFNTADSGDASLIYATYLGGSGGERVGSMGYGLGDWGHGIAADAAGNAYLTGQTSSTNYPTTLNAYQSSLDGVADVFVSKVNTAGSGNSSLIYSTYLGGSGMDAGKDVAVDAAGNAYVTGEAGSNTFPTVNRYMPCTLGPFVSKLNPGGSALVYSTCFGSGGGGRAADIAIDASGSAYIVGSTNSTSFPMVNPIQPANGGYSDAFVLKLVPAGNNLIFSTYLGGAANDEGIGIAVGGTNNTYVTGDTISTNFPVHNPNQGTCQSCPDHPDAFISTINESVPPPTSTPTIVPTSTRTNTPRPTATFTQVPGNHPPTIRVPLNEPYRVGVEIGNYLALRFDASDPDAGDTVRFSVTGLPSGASFPIPSPGNPIHSTFTWRPTAPDIGTYYMTVTATDPHGAQDNAVVRIDVVAGCVPYFTDVYPSQYFYPAVQYLFCHLVVQGYVRADQTFVYRPYYNTTRGQFSKMVALSYNLPQWNPPTPDFMDVPVTDTFYSYIEAAFHAGIINGYPCGGVGEPCVPPDNKPYFRTYASITRGQLSKLVVGAAHWPIDTSGGPHFSDVAVGSTFYTYIETAYQHGVISGYACGGAGEPCDPQNHAYFRPNNKAMRGQIAKILWLALGSPVP